MLKLILIKLRRYWWLLPLFIFDAVYNFFIQLVTSPPTAEGTTNVSIAWEAVGFIFLTSLVSLYCVLLVKRLLRKVHNSILLKYFKILILSLLVFTLIVAVFMITVEYLLGQQRDISYVLGNGLIFMFHHFIVSNAFTAYLYLKESSQLKQQLIVAEKMKTELELKTLQQQMSPHFLFNNLNTLTSLIDPNQKEALDFTKSLSSIYRYFTTNVREDVVSLSEELDFIQHYFELMRHRFGTAYQLKIESIPENASNILLLPMSLQIVIENVFKHNSGDRANPLMIHLDITESELILKNDIRKKASLSKKRNGTGLKNLDERCQLAFGKGIKYEILSNSFTVKIPLIKRIKDENIDN